MICALGPRRSLALVGTNSVRRSTRAEQGKQETFPARRIHAAFSAASESKELKGPFQLLAISTPLIRILISLFARIRHGQKDTGRRRLTHSSTHTGRQGEGQG